MGFLMETYQTCAIEAFEFAYGYSFFGVLFHAKEGFSSPPSLKRLGTNPDSLVLFHNTLFVYNKKVNFFHSITSFDTYSNIIISLFLLLIKKGIKLVENSLSNHQYSLFMVFYDKLAN